MWCVLIPNSNVYDCTIYIGARTCIQAMLMLIGLMCMHFAFEIFRLLIIQSLKRYLYVRGSRCYSNMFCVLYMYKNPGHKKRRFSARPFYTLLASLRNTRDLHYVQQRRTKELRKSNNSLHGYATCVKRANRRIFSGTNSFSRKFGDKILKIIRLAVAQFVTNVVDSRSLAKLSFRDIC